MGSRVTPLISISVILRHALIIQHGSFTESLEENDLGYFTDLTVTHLALALYDKCKDVD
jgi:hypothetical protein